MSDELSSVKSALPLRQIYTVDLEWELVVELLVLFL